MKPLSISLLTICGIEELPSHRERTVTHVLSVLDPDLPEIEAFQAYGAHHRTTLRFHDIIDPRPGWIMPTRAHMEEILSFGSELASSQAGKSDGHLLVHCHMGVSRSTAAMLSLLAQVYPDESEDNLFARLREIRPQAWPNSVMIGFADELLGREGRLTEGLRRHYGRQIEANPKLSGWMGDLGRSREVEMAVRA
ncbi:tyrosine phosphatase family protein [Microvirga pudoricolor]|uniref:tyrosine phosphatase family protein n=1 Tax=Microvirga pudoricolor TaxID=2778729 RepID=UPI00194F21A2|nr:hypothetical protein [Microvirga pudoricolor]MBM6594556.1 hypothetical protein [Microvirga pudoricolor]